MALLLAATGSRLTELTLAFNNALPLGTIANLHSLRKLTLDSSFASTAPNFGMLTVRHLYCLGTHLITCR